MKRIGFFTGHENYMPHATLLCTSLSSHFPKENGFEIVAMISGHRKIPLSIPGIKVISVRIPPEFRHIPFADKMLAAAVFEGECESGYLWMDVDSFFFKPVVFPDEPELLVNPVDQRNIGDAFGTQRGGLWHILYEYFALPPTNISVITGASRVLIYPYFNAGMVMANWNRGLFRSTKDAMCVLLARENLRELLKSKTLYSIFFHQAVFTCAALKLYGFQHIGDLPYGVNYPMHLHASQTKPMRLDDLASIRYDTFFERNEVPSPWRQVFTGINTKLVGTWYY